MQAFLFASLAAAQAAVAAIDPTQGMPLAGTDIGAGVHVPTSQSVTVTYAAIYENAAGTQWAMLADAVTTPNASIHAVSAIPTTIDLSSTGNWAGATLVWPTAQAIATAGAQV
jgi:hypothetical protein